MRVRRHLVLPLAATALVAAALGAAPGTGAQVPPLVSTTTTTTTAPPSGGADPSAPSGADLADGSSQAPRGAEDAGGDGAAAPAGGIRVPPDAQRIISSVRRSAPNGSAALVESLSALQDLGLSEAEALRVGMGRFPIAGPARYSHDWLYPRYGPGFRFHLGTDVFAAYGTPVRAPVDGIARSAEGGLGGLTVKVVMADGTYFYLAHLSGLVEGFTQDMPVRTGDIVGYVGDSGNARGGAPHLHLGVYPHGGPRWTRSRSSTTSSPRPRPGCRPSSRRTGRPAGRRRHPRRRSPSPRSGGCCGRCWRRSSCTRWRPAPARGRWRSST